MDRFARLGLAGATVGLSCWLGYRFLANYGRLLLRVEELEGRLAALSAAEDDAALDSGLPLGSTTADFELPSLAGGLLRFSRWRGRPVLLIFIDPGCPFSRALLPDLAALPTDPADGRPLPLVVTTGDAEANRRLAEEHGLGCPVLLQDDREVASVYEIDATPAGYLVDQHGLSASPLALGGAALLELANRPSSGLPRTDRRNTRAAGGASGDAGRVTRWPERSPAGSGPVPGAPAPDFQLPGLDGGELSLAARRGRPALLVFSDPTCPPCERLAPELERLHRRVRELAVLMVSRGDPQATRAQAARHGLSFPIGLQRRWEVSRRYGILATPIGYLVDEQGRIASDPAEGVRAILRLAGGDHWRLLERERSGAAIGTGDATANGPAAVRPPEAPARLATSESSGAWEQPLVSVVLTTHDRPRLLRVALACYQHQTYPNRELIVVDDGEAFPADADAVAAAGGRLIRVAPGTLLGAKLNRGVSEARGPLCQKMDDDDWYAPEFIERMVRAWAESRTAVCRPTLAFLTPFRFFDLARWEVRQTEDGDMPGATLMFDREAWEERPFRGLPGDEDVWMLLDQRKLGTTLLQVPAPELFLAVRHRGAARNHGHTWLRQGDGQILEEHLLGQPLVEGGPEALLPDWALAVYRELRHDLLATASAATPTPGAPLS